MASHEATKTAWVERAHVEQTLAPPCFKRVPAEGAVVVLSGLLPHAVLWPAFSCCQCRLGHVETGGTTPALPHVDPVKPVRRVALQRAEGSAEDAEGADDAEFVRMMMDIQP